ncbi:hypothetical protein [Methylocystis sp. JR02]|uniref:hypothetical protein n=1 Tax=Methylocystis sp. JR02 TaxID=3046284 RepID=UPI0024BBE7D1|nr:hypothetical protein [Methylocystis sp. JR02]MDJ0449721.1 hypothetical protein [Methylocystis sp. JR02]
MKVYFCINESGLVHYIDHLRAAVRSARQIGRLEPHILFDGDPAILKEALAGCEAAIHRQKSSIADEIAQTEETAEWRRGVAEGALLRLEIPVVETDDDYVLYCDCDTLFTRAVDLSGVKPRFLAAAPGHNPNEWDMICSGVLLLNVKNMRAEYPRYMKYAAANLGRPAYYDQEVLNEYFVGRIDRLPIEYHWKTYWGANPLAYIVHFHGLKRTHLAWMSDPIRRAELKKLYFLIMFENDGFDYYGKVFDSIAVNEAPSFARLILGRLNDVLKFSFRRARKLFYRLLMENVPSTFDETSYLYNNPDIAIGVYNGAIRSGWSHYRVHGKLEGRPGGAVESKAV